MVILSVHNSSDIYGASRSLHRMLEMFVRNGNEVHVVLPSNGPLVEMLQGSGIAVHVFPALAVIERNHVLTLHGSLSFIWRYITSVFWIFKLLRRLRPHVVHTNSSVLPAPGLAAYLARRPHFWHIREFLSEFPKLWKLYQRYMSLFSTRIITISESVQEQFIQRIQVQCDLVYNGLDESAHQVDSNESQCFRHRIGNPQFLVGVVGRIKWERKGQEVLIRAAGLLADKHPDARYVIVGTPSIGNEDHLIRLQQLIRQMGLEDRVTFTGDLKYLRNVYAAFDVTVVPSIMPEPFGRVVMESMAAGTPVIGSRCGGIPEQIQDGVSGLLVDPGDEHDLARALSQVMSDNALRERLSLAGKQRVDKQFTMNETFSKINELFTSHKRPKSIIVSVHNSSDLYGASRCIHSMLELFARDGHEVHIVLPNRGPLVELFHNSGVIVHIFPSLAIVDRLAIATLGGKLRFCFRFCISVFWLSALIIKLDADTVHTNTAVLPAPGLSASLTGRKHFWHIRELFSEFPRIWSHYQHYMWRFSDGIITISSAVRTQFQPRFQGQCTLIYDGLDEDAFAVDRKRAQSFRVSLNNPVFLVGVVGRIKWERKGQEVLVRAAALLADKHPEARYVIVGTPSPGNEDHLFRLQDLIRDLKVDDRLIFTADIRDIRDVYAAFDVTVVPSILPEPFGRVVIESMAAGTPVIGSRSGGISEQIIDGITGFLFAPGDEHELARALDKLMSDRRLINQFSIAGRHHVESNFRISNSFDQFRKIF